MKPQKRLAVTVGIALIAVAWRMPCHAADDISAAFSNAVLSVPVPAVTITNTTLATVFAEGTIGKPWLKNGWLLVVEARGHGKWWQSIHLDVNFRGGTFEDLLDYLSRELGSGVSWYIRKHGSGPWRMSVNGKAMDVRSFCVRFLDKAGKPIPSTQRQLILSTDDQLLGLLKEGKGNKSLVAFHLGKRYWKKNKKKGEEFLKLALESAKTSQEKWEMRYELLSRGIACSDAMTQKHNAVDRWEAFLRDCDDGAIKQMAETKLLDCYFDGNMDEEGSALLIEIAKRSPKDWQSAAMYYKRKRPDSPAPIVDGKKLVPFTQEEVDSINRATLRSIHGNKKVVADKLGSEKTEEPRPKK